MEEQVMPKTLYGKLKQIKVELRKSINTKSGYNTHSKFKYYQLEDFLPQVLEAFSRYNIYNEYSIDTDLEIIEERTEFDEENNKTYKTVTKKPVEYAYLYLKNLDNEDDEMVYRLKTAEASVYGAAAIQNLGAKITYMKRYIYMSLLDIVEPDAVDAAPQGNTPQPVQQVAPQPTINYTTNVSEMHKGPVAVQTDYEPQQPIELGPYIPQEQVVTNNVTIEPTTGATSVEEPMTLETKTLIAQMLLSKGKNPAEGVQLIAQQLNTPVEQFKESQRQVILDMIERM